MSAIQSSLNNTAASSALSIAVSNAPERVQLGTRLAEHSLKVANFATEAKVYFEKGTGAVCAVTTLTAAASSFISGNNITAAALATCGIAEFCKIITNTPKDTLSGLLENAQSGVVMINHLEKANSSSLRDIQTNVVQVGKEVENLNKLLESIKGIADNGEGRIAEYKSVAKKVCESAALLFSEANKNFKDSSIFAEKVNKKLGDNIVTHNKLVAAVNKGGEEGFKQFCMFAKIISDRSAIIANLLKKSNSARESGVALFADAYAMQFKATMAAKDAYIEAENCLKLIAVKSIANEECAKKLDAVSTELVVVKDRDADKHKLLKQISNDLKDAKRVQGKKFGHVSILFGGGIGAVVGNCLGGPLGLVIGLEAGVHVVHNRGMISNLVNKTYEFLFGKTEADYKQASDVNPLVSYQFEARSSGYWNRYYRRNQSWTNGRIILKIGKQTLKFDFNLNSKHNKITEKDISVLTNALVTAIVNREITHRECLELMTILENITIRRGVDGSSQTATGFVIQNSPYLNELKRLCFSLAK